LLFATQLLPGKDQELVFEQRRADAVSGLQRERPGEVDADD